MTTAGSNTTAYVLAYMMYALGADPILQQQLRDEVARLSKQTNGKLDYNTLQTSELLTAFVKESTRITNPVPIALPRYLPKNSAPVQISGSVIPPGTTVEMSPGQLFFDESIYGPNTDKFDIKRWLSSENDAATLAKRHKYWLPFGGGSYICLGIWMAYMELYIGAAKILDSGLWLELGEAMKREKEGSGWQGRDEFVMYKIGEKPVIEVSMKA
jgi:cytochrome P450